ncbi:MAG: cyclase family protein [Acidimicrobiales bacterium]
MPDTQTPAVDWFERTFEEIKNWGRWGADDQRGALNLLTPERTAAAARLVQDGVTVSCALPLDTHGSDANPTPAQHHMLTAGDVVDEAMMPGLEQTADFVGIACHGMAVSHLDALCHVAVKGHLYNGVPLTEVRSSGARRLAVTEAADGIAGRGVLLDLPRIRGVDWLEPTDRVMPADLEAAEAQLGVSVQPGDILLVAIGRSRRRQVGKKLALSAAAGLHPYCGPWMKERDIAVLGTDGFGDAFGGDMVLPWPVPIHMFCLAGMGVHLLDNLDLAPLADACAERGRYEFFLNVAPLHIPGGTGCAVNPIAVF